MPLRPHLSNAMTKTVDPKTGRFATTRVGCEINKDSVLKGSAKNGPPRRSIAIEELLERDEDFVRPGQRRCCGRENVRRAKRAALRWGMRQAETR